MPFKIGKWQTVVAASLTVLAINLILSQSANISHIVGMMFLFWHYIFIAFSVIVLVAALLWKKVRLPALGLFFTTALCFSWPFLSDFTANQAIPTENLGRPLKVVTFNWLGGNSQLNSVYDWLSMEKPDILAIEEFSGKAAGVEERLYKLYPSHTVKANDVIILSKFPIVSQHVENINGRTVSVAALQTPQGEVVVYGIHAPTLRTVSDLAQRNGYLLQEAQRIHDKAPGRIMLGDFNATRWDPHFRELVDKNGLHEQPRLFPLATRVAVRHGDASVGSPIDHILIKGGRIANCRTGPALGSDHLPLICDVSFPRIP
jgi:vancomycin resistance protein VanJ